MLEEDNWGFSNKLDSKRINTSEWEKNPFIFTNAKKATGTVTNDNTVVKHAEAVSINHFGSGERENYKSNEKFDTGWLQWDDPQTQP